MPTTTPAADRGLTPGQTAAALGVDVLTVRRWMRTEQCPVVRVGAARRIPTAWVASQPEYSTGGGR